VSARTTYCVVPAGTDADVIQALRRRYASDPNVTVIIDRRNGGRDPGRYGSNRRRPVLRRHIDQDAPGADQPGVRFENHLPPIGVDLADAPLEDVVARALEHDPEACAELRWRYYEVVNSRLHARLRSQTAAERAVPAMMDALQEELVNYHPDHDFTTWLVDVVDNAPLPHS
jgi:hypothetical protein